MLLHFPLQKETSARERCSCAPAGSSCGRIPFAFPFQGEGNGERLFFNPLLQIKMGCPKLLRRTTRTQGDLPFRSMAKETKRPDCRQKLPFHKTLPTDGRNFQKIRCTPQLAGGPPSEALRKNHEEAEESSNGFSSDTLWSESNGEAGSSLGG